MGVTIPVGFGQLTIPFTLTGDAEEMVCTLGFDDDGTSTPNTIATTLQTQLFAEDSWAASSLAVGYTVGPCRVVVNRTLGTFEGQAGTSRAGTNAGLPVPSQNVAVLVRKITARGGRAGRGRLFLPGLQLGEGNVTATGVILQSLVDSWTADFNSFLAACTTVGFPLVLLHQDPEVGPPLPPDPITGFAVQPVVATQRTRLRR